MSEQQEARVEAQLKQLWELVAELGSLSERLKKAADEAVEALRAPDNEEKK